MTIARWGLVAVVALWSSVWAYEVETHGNVTKAAARSSVLADRLADFGESFGLSSLDSVLNAPDDVCLLGSNWFEVARPVMEWMRKGAIDEDNTCPDGFNGSIARYRNHFYNPLNGEGYRYGIFSGLPSDAWGLRMHNPGPQRYSFLDARRYFYRALTEADEKERRRQLALTFSSVGHVAHLVQDLAQPQHTRNDSHAGGSAYERYVDGRRERLTYTGYPVGSIRQPQDIWHTPEGKGLADYSNRGFITAGTNFGGHPGGLVPAPGFPNPSGAGTGAKTRNVEELFPPGENTAGLRGKISFITGRVPDALTGQDSREIRLSTYSVFDDDLAKANKAMTFSLNRFNFDDMLELLIPRASGYSTGLIDYFYRGKLDFLPDPDDPGKHKIKNLGKEPIKGVFALYYDDKDKKRHEVPGARWELEIGPGQEAKGLAFTPPSDPAPAIAGEYMLVFSGNMGEEKAENGSVGAVAAKYISAYRGVLYIAALDQSNSVVTLRVDKTGTRRLQSGEFNPLKGLYFSGYYEIQDYMGVVIKPAVMKQVVFSGTDPARMSYRVRAFTVTRSGRGYQSFLLDPQTDRYLEENGAIAWWVDSQQPEARLKFRWEGFYGTPEQRLRYTGTYRDGNGQVQSVSGVLGVPPPPNPAAPPMVQFGQMHTGLADILFVSADGRTLDGFEEAYEHETDRYSLMLTAGENPSAMWLVSGEDGYRYESLDQAEQNTVVGSSSTTMPACGDRPALTSTGSRVRTTWREGYDVTVATTRPIGYFNGELKTVRNTVWSYKRYEDDFTRGGATVGAGCPQGDWVLSQEEGDAARLLQQRSTWTLDDGSVSGHWIDNEGYAVSYEYEGWRSAMLPLQRIPSDQPPTGYGGLELVRSFGPASQNALMGDYVPYGVQAQAYWHIRGHTFMPSWYVADSSPLGELFFALPDRSVVIHEPRPGGMRKLEIPGDVVKLLAAIWL